jgi:nucleotide-binding universal stress UspA family protein
MSMKYETSRGAVVVGVDRTPAGRQALTWAARRAHLEGRRLVLVRATGSLGTTGTTWLDSADPAASPVLQRIEAEGSDIVSQALEQLRHAYPDHPMEEVVVEEDAEPALRRLSEQAHLVVVGSDGHGLTPHGTPWQVGPQLARHAGCPVVVVPRHNVGAVRRGVLVGTDLSERSATAVRFAYETASMHRLPLVVMHVAREGQAERVGDVERALAESVSGLAEEFPDVAARTEVAHGWPTGRLIQESALMHLLVIGRHHKPGPFESPLGHVRSGMVARAACPVAVVPTAAEHVAHA